MTYEEICNYEVLYKAFLKAKEGKRKKESEAKYEQRALLCTEKLRHDLLTKKYYPRPFNIFYVYEPKQRIVQAPAFVDKVVQHAMVDNYVYDAITHSFIPANAASQKGKGTHFALQNLKHDMQTYFRKRKGKAEERAKRNGLDYPKQSEWDYANGWVLKCDIHHFFASIDHDLCKAKLRKKIADDDVYNMMCMYIDSSEGLPLGYQTSQLFALLYLDEMDHFIKEKLHIKYYGRYMDDFYLIHEDKKYLQYCLKELRKFLGDLKLELNNKTAIFPLKNGIDFLGFHTYLTETGKVIMKLRRSSIKRMNKRIKIWAKLYPEGKITKEEIIQSFKAWNAHAAHGDTYSLRKKYKKKVEEIIKEAIVI